MTLETRLLDARRAGPPFAVGVLAVLGTLPVVTAVEPLAGVPRWLVVVAVIAVGVAGVGVTAVVGAALAVDVGLRAFAPERLPGEGIGAYRLPVGVGVGVALATLCVHAVGGAAGVDVGPINRWVVDGSLGVLASVAGGVVTELVFRYGFMTLVVWTAWTYRPAADAGVTRASVWAGILAAAALAGCVAVPGMIAAGGDPAAVALTVGVSVGGSVVFGLLYWRYDLAAAVVAHGVASVLRAVIAGL